LKVNPADSIPLAMTVIVEVPVRENVRVGKLSCGVHESATGSLHLAVLTRH